MSSECTAVLFQSFGGPESPHEVMPFLRRVTAGRNIPQARLENVAEHYYHIGGKSPINDDNRLIISRLQHRLAAAGLPYKVYFGNRNSSPYVWEALEEIINDGHTHIAVLRTSAWGGFSGYQQYQDDLYQASYYLACQGKDTSRLQFISCQPYYDNPYFLAGYSSIAQESRDRLAKKYSREKILTIFTAHSVPVGEKYASDEYACQVYQAMTAISTLANLPHTALAWQSGSGSADSIWLEPDIKDVIENVDSTLFEALSIVPLGFITDHVEVLWDLDHEAKEVAQTKNFAFERASTIGLREEFIDLCWDLIYPAMLKK